MKWALCITGHACKRQSKSHHENWHDDMWSHVRVFLVYPSRDWSNCLGTFLLNIQTELIIWPESNLLCPKHLVSHLLFHPWLEKLVEGGWQDVVLRRLLHQTNCALTLNNRENSRINKNLNLYLFKFFWGENVTTLGWFWGNWMGIFG